MSVTQFIDALLETVTHSYSHVGNSSDLKRPKLEKFTEEIPGFFFLKPHISVPE